MSRNRRGSSRRWQERAGVGAGEERQQGGVGVGAGEEVTGRRGLMVLPGYLLGQVGLRVVGVTFLPCSMPLTLPRSRDTSLVRTPGCLKTFLVF